MWYKLQHHDPSFSMNKQLFAAASEGDLELVKNLLTQGADKEYIDVKVS